MINEICFSTIAISYDCYATIVRFSLTTGKVGIKWFFLILLLWLRKCSNDLNQESHLPESKEFIEATMMSNSLSITWSYQPQLVLLLWILWYLYQSMPAARTTTALLLSVLRPLLSLVLPWYNRRLYYRECQDLTALAIRCLESIYIHNW